MSLGWEGVGVKSKGGGLSKPGKRGDSQSRCDSMSRVD